MTSKAEIPTGFRFAPCDDELIIHYLAPKVAHEPLPPNQIHEVNIYESDPKTLSETYKAQGDGKWYFFSSINKFCKHGVRTKRSAREGFWKATDSSKPVIHNGVEIGCKRSLAYHQGKPPNDNRTNWLMHEFTVETKASPQDMELDDIVLCRMYEKKGRASTGKRPLEESEGFNAVKKTALGQYNNNESSKNCDGEMAQPQPLDQNVMESNNFCAEGFVPFIQPQNRPPCGPISHSHNLHQQTVYHNLFESHPLQHMVQPQPLDQHYVTQLNSYVAEGNIDAFSQDLRYQDLINNNIGEGLVPFVQEPSYQDLINNNVGGGLAPFGQEPSYQDLINNNNQVEIGALSFSSQLELLNESHHDLLLYESNQGWSTERSHGPEMVQVQPLSWEHSSFMHSNNINTVSGFVGSCDNDSQGLEDLQQIVGVGTSSSSVLSELDLVFRPFLRSHDQPNLNQIPNPQSFDGFSDYHS